MRCKLCILVALLVAGCGPTIWNRPGATQADFNQDDARCRLVAQGMNSGGFYAQGSPGFVAGASVGNAIGTAISTQATYRNCMVANGYTEQSAQPTVFQSSPATASSTPPTSKITFDVKCIKAGQDAPIGFFQTPDECLSAGGQVDQTYQSPTALISVFQAAGQQLQSCLLEIWNSPENEPLRRHGQPNIQDVTLYQMTDKDMATDAEIKIILDLRPKGNACRQTALDQISRTTPTLAQIIASGFTKYENSRIDLIKKKQSWGEHTKRMKLLAVEMKGQLTAELQRINAGPQPPQTQTLTKRQVLQEAITRCRGLSMYGSVTAATGCSTWIDLDPTNAEAYYDRGNAYNTSSFHDQAIADYTKAITLKPGFALAYYTRGTMYFADGLYDQAISDYTKAILHKPNDAWAYEGRGEAHEKKDQPDQAIADYRTALKIVPDLKEAQDNLLRLGATP